MNNPPESSAVATGKLKRSHRKAEPLPPESSAVKPPESSAVSHGSAFRVVSLSVCLKIFQGVSQSDLHADKQLVAACRRVLALLRSSLKQIKIKNSKGLKA